MHYTDFMCEYGKCYKRDASKRSDVIVPQSIFSLLLSSVLMRHRYCLCCRLEWNWAETGCSEEMEIRLRICMGPCAGPSYQGPCHRHHMKLFKLISPGRSSAAPFSEAPTQTLIDTHSVHYHDFYPFSFPWHDKKFNYKNLHFTAISLDKQMFFHQCYECLTLISHRHSTAWFTCTQNWVWNHVCSGLWRRIIHLMTQ